MGEMLQNDLNYNTSRKYKGCMCLENYKYNIEKETKVKCDKATNREEIQQPVGGKLANLA